MEYKLASSINIHTLNNLIKDIENLITNMKKGDSFTFDFTNCSFISPTAVAYISLTKDRMNQMGIDTFLRYRRNSKLTGFLKIFGIIENIQYDDSVIESFSKYTVKIHRCSNINECHGVHKSIMDKVVERTSCKKDTFSAVDYMLNEIWDNAGVHGYRCYRESIYPRPIYMCAFSYKDKVEIAIADTGQGIHKSLKKQRPDLSAKDSLTEAIKDGVSGHPNGSPGFGLYCSTEFTKSNSGVFNIWSSGRYLRMQGSSVAVNKSYFTDGTIVSFEISKNINIPFNEILSKKNPQHKMSTDDYLELIDGLVL